MLNPDEERWVRSTANELNNLLQVISDSSEQLARLSEDKEEAERYLTMLRESLSRATLVTHQLAQKVGGLQPVTPPQPVAQPAPAKKPAPPRRAATGPVASPVAITILNPTGARELIMIVDDEEFVTMLASRVLAGEGFRVINARSGFEAIDFYKRLHGEISLVILDYSMPELDGAEVFAELKQINPQAAVILSSGFTEQERLRALTARGLKGFLPKPYTNQRLLDQVRQTLAEVKR